MSLRYPGAPSCRAVLDLPRVVEHVPGHPADEVPRQPALAAPGAGWRRVLHRGRRERVEDRGARPPGLGGLRARLNLAAEHPNVAAVGVHDVGDDLAELPPAAAGAL